jgi:hypothetical protein
MDLGRFKELSEKDQCKLTCLGPDIFILSARKYDPATGAEATPELHQLNRAQVDAAMDAAKKQIETLRTALVSLTALRAKMDDLSGATA